MVNEVKQDFINVCESFGLSLDHLVTGVDVEIMDEIFGYIKPQIDILNQINSDSSDSKFYSSILLFSEYIKSNNLTAQKGLIEKLDKDDVIEIYSATDFTQQWRSLNFHKYCSYKLTDLLTKPFHELFSRPESVNKQIILSSQKVLSSVQMVSLKHIKEHYLTELSERRRLLIKMKYMAPLLSRDGKISSVVTTLSASAEPFKIV